MTKLSVKTILICAAATWLAGCDRAAEAGTSANAGAPSARSSGGGSPFDVCADRGTAIMVGDTNIQIKATGTDFRWKTSGNFVTLTQQGSGKAIELVVSTSPGGPSLPKGDCLRSGGYIRLARNGDTGPNRYLQALRYNGTGADPNHVVIGNYPDQMINSIFNVVKVAGVEGNSDGAIIRQGDVIRIRGVSRDPWTVAPANPTEGSPVGLIDDIYAQATNWTINRHGPPVGG